MSGIQHRIGSKIVRQGYVCPVCDCIKDAYDPEYGEVRSSRWCHNYRVHGAKRKMRPVALIRYDEGGAHE